MNKKCKILAGILAVLLTVSLAGCGETVETTDASNETSSAEISSVAQKENVSSENTEDTESSENRLSEELWRDAYAAFLRNPKYYDEFEKEFALYDMDKNGIPELFTHSYMCSYKDNEIVIESLHSRRVHAPSDKAVLGVFVEQGNGARMLSLGYCKIADDQLYHENIYTPAMYGEKEVIINSDLYAAFENSNPLPYCEINEVNIQKYIYGQTDLAGNTELLRSLPYVGVSTISMSVEQAKAFIKVIEGSKAQEKNGKLIVVLTDGGNGIPVLWVGVECADEVNNNFLGIWQWNGNTAEKIVIDAWHVSYASVNGETYMIGRNPSLDIGEPSVSLAYKLSNGKMNKVLYSTHVSIALFSYSTPASFEEQFYMNRSKDFYLDIPALFERFNADGMNYEGVYFQTNCIDGVPEANADKSKIAFWEKLNNEDRSVYVGNYASFYFEGPFADANKVLPILESYVSQLR